MQQVDKKAIIKIDWIKPFKHPIDLIRALFGSHTFFIHELIFAKDLDDFLTKCDNYTYSVLEDISDYDECIARSLSSEWNSHTNQLWLQLFYHCNKEHINNMFGRHVNKIVYVNDSFEDNATIVVVQIRL